MAHNLVRVGESNRNLVLAACFIGAVLYSVDRAIFPPVFPLVMADLKLQYAQQGSLFSGFFVGYATIPLVAGFLSDRIGRARMMVAGLLVFSVGTVLTGTASGYGDAMLWRVVTGVGEGMFWVPAVAMLGLLFGDMRGRALGILQAGYPMGYFLGTILSGAMAQATGSWRMPFYVSGALTLIAAAVVFLFVTEPKRGEAAAMEERASAWRLFRERNLLIAAVGLFVAQWGSYAVSAWLPSFFAQERGLSLTMAATLTALLGLSGTVGYIVCGALSDRIGRKTTLVIGAFGCALFGVLVLEMTALWQLVPVLLVGAILAGALIPVIMAIAVDSAPPALAGAATGLVTQLGTFSGMISPTLAGQVAEVSSIQYALYLHWLLPIALVGVLGLLLHARSHVAVSPQSSA